VALEEGAMGCVFVKDTDGAMDQTIADIVPINCDLERVLLTVGVLQ
jgi:hypothetical protein